MDTGLIHIYTGDGKGKTTAAVGMAVRARSRGFSTLFAQFFKEKDTGSEVGLLEKMGIATIVYDRVKSPLFNPDMDIDLLREEAKRALLHLGNVLSRDRFDFMVLDEFICMISQGVLAEDRAIEFLSSRPAHLEVILTGYGASERLIGIADYVTVMQHVKHPYEKKIKARQGIEY